MPASEILYLKKFLKTCPNTNEIYNQSISLPSSTLNDEKGIKNAALIIKEILKD
jgi:dTDP-4-amino-4,6-dideoxygalactose transaminase